MPDDKNPKDAVEQKFEVKDGVMLVDGKKVVHESDLIAAKRSLEQSIEAAQAAHNEAIDKAKLDLSGVQTQLAAASAKVKELEAARSTSAVSAEDAAKQKTDLGAAKKAATDATNAVLEFRKKNITLQYNGVTLEQLKDKTSVQLDALEEALKAVASHGGAGPYAVGGGAGGADPMDDDARAKAILARTPIRGLREAAPAK